MHKKDKIKANKKRIHNLFIVNYLRVIKNFKIKSL